MEFHESDYDLTVTQARQIQSNLVASGRPQRLLSDAEKAEKEREIIAKREKVQEVRLINTIQQSLLPVKSLYSVIILMSYP